MDPASPNGSANAYRSGAIEIDAMQRCVSIDGARARLGARAFDVLLALVERRDRVVSKRELMDVVWPRVVVEENNLLVHMVALRKLLGPHAIATIPGRGYRFVMPLVTVVPDVVAAQTRLPNRGNLPASSTLIGREGDLAAVNALVSRHSVVSIVGAPGIGKTRLALAVAGSVTIDAPDGRWWVELAPITDGAQVPGTIAAALGAVLGSGRNADEALATSLAGRRLLLVLDNC